MKSLRHTEIEILQSNTRLERTAKWSRVSGAIMMIVALFAPVWIGHSSANAAQGHEIVAWGAMALPNAPLRNITAITAGSRHNLALKTDGSIIGWGYDRRGQATPPVSSDFTAIAAGEGHSLALKTDGSFVGWGYNGEGQTNPPFRSDSVGVSASKIGAQSEYTQRTVGGSNTALRVIVHSTLYHRATVIFFERGTYWDCRFAEKPMWSNCAGKRSVPR